MIVFSEPPDLPGTGTPVIRLDDGGSIRGALSPGDDGDAVLVSAALGFDYWITVSGRGDTPLSGYVLRAVDGAGRFGGIAEADADGRAWIAPNAADLGFPDGLGTAPRDFVVRVESPQSGPVTGGYQIDLILEEGRTTQTAVSLAPGEHYDGAFEYRGDEDMIALEVVAGRDYAVTFDIRESRAAGELFTLNSREFDLRVFSEDSAQGGLSGALGSISSSFFSASFTAEQSGAYYLLAENDKRDFEQLNFGAETGRYTVRFVENQPEDATSPSRFAVGETVRDSIDFLGDTDWWGAELEAGVAYRVHFSVATGDGRVASFLEIFDAEGREAGQIDAPRDFSERFPVEGVFTPEEDGLYFFAGRIFAELGDSRLRVSLPGELIEGGDTGERLTGTPGDDTILGNGGNDVLIGGGGDGMTGGAGGDTFVFRPGEATVTVSDFDKSAGDRLALDDRFFGLGGPGIDPRPVSQAQARAALDAGKVIYDRDSGELWIDGDGAGRGEDAALVAVLEGGPGFTFEDVLLF